MKKGQILEGQTERVDYPDRGIVKTEEGPLFVKAVLPQERLKVLVTKKRRGRAEGRVLEVLEKSPLEKRQPLCEAFPACGGCSWQTMNYEDQLALKEGQIQRLLSPVLEGAGSNQSWEQVYEGIHPGPKETNYRNKMEFAFGDSEKDGPLTLGLHCRGSRYDIAGAGDCAIAHSDMCVILSCTLDYFRELGIPYYHRMTHEGILRHLLLRRSEASGEVLVALVTAEELPSAVLEAFVRRLKAQKLEGHIAGILHMLNRSVADVVKSERTSLLYGQDFITETLLGLSFKITPFSFFQTNSKGAELLYTLVRDYAGEIRDLTVFDLYCGTGTIAQILSPVAKRVIGVEIVEEAVEAARENARMNGLKNCTFYAGDVLEVLDTIEEEPDLIVLDPPREGVHPKALSKILAYQVPRILYISCKATSLARDLTQFFAAGYRVNRITLADLFPQTANTECLCLLTRQ